MDQKKQPFSCSNHSLNEKEKIFQLFLLVSISSPVSGSVAPRTYYTNCSFPKSDCQQKAGNQSNNFDWNFHYFGSFLVLIFTNLFAPQEIWHFETFPKLKFGPINSSCDKYEIHYHKWHFMVGQTQMSPSLYDFQSVMGELKCLCGIIWTQYKVEPMVWAPQCKPSSSCFQRNFSLTYILNSCQNAPFPAKICLANAMHIVKGNAWALFKTIVCQYVFPVFP